MANEDSTSELDASTMSESVLPSSLASSCASSPGSSKDSPSKSSSGRGTKSKRKKSRKTRISVGAAEASSKGENTAETSRNSQADETKAYPSYHLKTEKIKENCRFDRSTHPDFVEAAGVMSTGIVSALQTIQSFFPNQADGADGPHSKSSSSSSSSPTKQKGIQQGSLFSLISEEKKEDTSIDDTTFSSYQNPPAPRLQVHNASPAEPGNPPEIFSYYSSRFTVHRPIPVQAAETTISTTSDSVVSSTFSSKQDVADTLTTNPNNGNQDFCYTRSTPMARMREVDAQQASALEDEAAASVPPRRKSHEQVKAEKQRKWKKRMKMAKKRKQQERRELDEEDFGENIFSGGAFVKQVIGQVVPESSDIFRMLRTRCGHLDDTASDSEDDSTFSSSAGFSEQSSWTQSESGYSTMSPATNASTAMTSKATSSISRITPPRPPRRQPDRSFDSPSTALRTESAPTTPQGSAMSPRTTSSDQGVCSTMTSDLASLEQKEAYERTKPFSQDTASYSVDHHRKQPRDPSPVSQRNKPSKPEPKPAPRDPSPVSLVRQREPMSPPSSSMYSSQSTADARLASASEFVSETSGSSTDPAGSSFQLSNWSKPSPNSVTAFLDASGFPSPSSSPSRPSTNNGTGFDTRQSPPKHQRQTQNTSTTSGRVQPSSSSPEPDASRNTRSKSGIKAFIEELTKDGVQLLWHKEPNSMSPSKVMMNLKLGYRNPSGGHCGPRLIWSDTSAYSAATYGIDLFDIRSLEKASTLNLQDYPYAIPSRSIFLKLTRGCDFVFETASDAEAVWLVDGMRNVIARLAHSLVVGNLDVSCELLDVGLEDCDESSLFDQNQHRSRKTALEQSRWTKAMDDVTNQLVEKALFD